MRVAVKVAYDGTRFSGSQVQPRVRTVHGEVVAALEQLGAKEPRIWWAGRTDAGVSAAANVVVFDSPVARETLPSGLTHHMEDAWAWAAAPVADDFEPRHATSRWYRYHLRADVESERLSHAMQVFLGEHDFTSFSRIEPGVNPRRTVTSIRVARRGSFLAVDVEGPNFLYNQVRRMVEAGRQVAAGDINAADVRAALDEGRHQDFGVARAEPLVLMDVSYAKVPFERPARAVLRRALARLKERVQEREMDLMRLQDMLGQAEGE